ncbi:hypothetical protein [Marinifilum caeruleilacunae]|nr:hypothetical protein [Marinifilum caeruleilacunae]
MKTLKMTGMKIASTILLLLIAFNSFAQSRNLKTKTSKDGESIVKYEVKKVDGGTHIYYVVERSMNVSLEELDNYFLNPANHKYFLENTPQSEEVQKLSDQEWINYYYFDAPWPMPDSDVVVKINRAKQENQLVFTASAIKNDYKQSDVERLTSYQFKYEFENMPNGTTKIRITADFISPGSAPKFLVNTWFPEGPAKIALKLGSKVQS